MDIRYSCNQRDFKKYDTEAIRTEFLIEQLFPTDDLQIAYSHVDRVLVLSTMPVTQSVSLETNIDCWKNLGVNFFLERRELGIINVGGPGVVRAANETYQLSRLDALYLSMSTKEVYFQAVDPSNPPKFYMCSAPAHRAYPTKLITFNDAIHRELGSSETANARIIHQFIHPEVLETCQLSMGCTILKPGSVWNTMPSHTHERRMEVYMYFDIPNDQVVFHYMGEPTETRHVVMQNEQAIISPSWSIHSGCGTANYAFIWSMLGENKVFDDMDHIKNQDLK